MFSMKKTSMSDFDGFSWFRFFVMTSPALQNSLSLAMEVTGMQSIQSVTYDTKGSVPCWHTTTEFSDGQYDGFIFLGTHLDSKLRPVHYDANAADVGCMLWC